MMRLAVVAILAIVASGSLSDLTFDTQAAKNRPVAKVVTLLKDMLKQLEKEGEADQEVYDEIACWCTTNDKAKSKAVADAEARIEELSALSVRLNTEIANLQAEVAQLQDALKK